MLDILLLVLLGFVTFMYFGYPLEPFACSRDRSYGWPYYWKITNLPDKCCGKHYTHYNRMCDCIKKNVIYLV